MPSPWSSAGSVKDATTLANRLGINHQKIPISDVMNSFNDVLSNSIWGIPIGITAENLQSRIRGTILMAIANQKKHLTINLEDQLIILEDGNKVKFQIDPFRKKCLLEGLDDIGLTLQKKEKIDQYEASLKNTHPWII